MLPTYTLPKPQSESVKYIFHLSDIHIRNGDSVVTRYSEYKTVFDSIVNYFQTVSKDTVVVITGDIFHNKNSLGASGIKLFTELVLKLAASAPVYIIRGNHDYRQDKPEEPDMIVPFMNMFPDNVVYMDKEGYYQVNEDIGFALMPIQKTLQSGSTCGSVENLPPFPPAEGLQTKTKVALFHGSIPQRIPLSWFGTGWDYILLGDIHAQNIYGGTQLSGLLDPKPTAEGIYKIGTINRNDKNTLWGYPGSTVQQGFGETILGHGFCIWDLQQKHVELYHVANQSGCIDVKKIQDVWSVKLSHPLYTAPLAKASGFQKFAVSLAMRITLGKLGVSGLNCRQLFLDEGFTACDGDNLSSVPEFINGLLTNMFDMVILVTHIEELKSLGNLTLNIERNELKGTSKVVFGNPAQLARKKRGRPRKYDI